MVQRRLLNTLLGASLIPLISALPTTDSTIQWTPCNLTFGFPYDYLPQRYPYQCGEVEVPLDYTDPGAGVLSLNLVRVEALNKPAKKSILVNPGGPGASGVEFIANSAESLHKVLGGNYDLIGFDPRGVGKTIPFNCSGNRAPEINITLPADTVAPKDALISFDLLEELDLALPVNKEFAERCSKNMKDIGSLLGTAFVARDLLNIMDALGEDGLLNYIGVSYGTYIGQTFVSMFPDRVGSVLLDSNINPQDWRSGLHYTTQADADVAFHGFLTECVERPDNCTIAKYAPSGDPLELLAWMNGLSGTIENFDSAIAPTWYDFKKFLHTFLYEPMGWGILTEAIEREFNGTSTDTDEVPEPVTPDDDEDEDLPTINPPWNEGIHALFGIMCSESLWRASSREEYLPVIAKQKDVSMFVDTWHHLGSWLCAQWKMEAKEVYDGDFTASPINPVLFVNGMYDPVTPLSSAYNASAGIEKSVVLTHGGFGHGIYSHPSLCTADAVRRYFDKGVLPEEGTVCAPDVDVFDLDFDDLGLGSVDPGMGLKRRSMEGDMTEEDVELLKAMRDLGLRLNRINGGF